MRKAIAIALRRAADWLYAEPEAPRQRESTVSLDPQRPETPDPCHPITGGFPDYTVPDGSEEVFGVYR